MRISIGLFIFLLSFGVPAMADSKPFICVNEKDHLPPLDPQADAWYREAVALAKPDTLRPWGRIVDLYSKAVERGHWKAMHNLANLYRTGWPGGVEKDTQKALDLYQKMIDLEVPQGFYDMGAMIGNRAGVKNPATDGLTFLFISGVFDKASPDVDRMWYAPDEKLHKLYDGIYDQLAADPDLRFPNLIKDHPLPPHPTQGYDADRPDWKPGQ